MSGWWGNGASFATMLQVTLWMTHTYSNYCYILVGKIRTQLSFLNETNLVMRKSSYKIIVVSNLKSYSLCVYQYDELNENASSKPTENMATYPRVWGLRKWFRFRRILNGHIKQCISARQKPVAIIFKNLMKWTNFCYVIFFFIYMWVQQNNWILYFLIIFYAFFIFFLTIFKVQWKNIHSTRTKMCQVYLFKYSLGVPMIFINIFPLL